jgi:hypothetical protein
VSSSSSPPPPLLATDCIFGNAVEARQGEARRSEALGSRRRGKCDVMGDNEVPDPPIHTEHRLPYDTERVLVMLAD